jgi:hypothetical protein
MSPDQEEKKCLRRKKRNCEKKTHSLRPRAQSRIKRARKSLFFAQSRGRKGKLSEKRVYYFACSQEKESR